MHNTTLMRLVTKKTFRWEKSAERPIKPQQPKQPREKKQKKHRENQKKQKKLGFQGKVLGVTSPKSLVFFCFSRVLLFFFLCVFWFARGFFVGFLIFQTISQKCFRTCFHLDCS